MLVYSALISWLEIFDLPYWPVMAVTETVLDCGHILYMALEKGMMSLLLMSRSGILSVVLVVVGVV